MHTPKAERLTQLMLEIFRVNGALISEGDKIAQVAGQTSSRWQVLGALHLKPQTVSQVARKMGLTRQSVQRTANLLVKEGLCSFSKNPMHRRAELLGLSTKGERALSTISKNQVRWSNALSESFSKRNIEIALETLRHLTQALEP